MRAAAVGHQQAQDDHYGDERSLALAYAGAVNEELRDLKAAGADVVQIDEPYLQARPEAARRYALEAIDRALAGIDDETVPPASVTPMVHDKPTGPRSCVSSTTALPRTSRSRRPSRASREALRELPDKTIVLGVLDLGASEVESADLVTERIRSAIEVVPPERLVVAPDCGMKYLPRELAFGKLCAMVAGARQA